MKKSKVIFLALLACAFGASAETFVGTLNGNPYDSLDKMIEDAKNIDAEIVMYTNATLSAYLNVTTNCIIRGRDAQCVISPSSSAGFCISTGGSLTVSNIMFTGYADVDTTDDYGFIGINGGELTLDDGAALDGLKGQVSRGSGIVDLNSGKMTMRDGSSIVNCRAEGGNSGEGYGGAIYVMGEGCELNLKGGVISNCYASTCGGGIYACGWNDNAGINVSGNLTIADNKSGDDTTADDLYMYSAAAITGLKLVGELEGQVGIRYSSSDPGNAEGDAFVTNVVGVATAPAFFNDTDDTLTAVAGENNMLVWAKKTVDDGQCDEKFASAHVYCSDGNVHHYTNLVTALTYMTTGTTAHIEMRRGEKESPNKGLRKYDTISTLITLPADCHLTLTAGEAGYRVRRYRTSGIAIPSGTSLAISNLVMDSSVPGSVTNAFLIVNGGSLMLGDGACVSNIIGNASADAAAIFVCNEGVVTMESGSRIFGCQNTNNYDMVFDEGVKYGCGGGILVSGGKAFLHGGEIANCLATRGGGVYACNESTVHVSGNMRITGNRWQKANGDQPAGNVYIADNSELCLDGPLTGKIGKGAEYYVGGAGDSNLVATVGYAWSGDVENLMESATNFVHDVTGETGVAVTNSTGALIVWCGAVKNGIYAATDGQKYVLISLAENTPMTLGPLPELSSNGKNSLGVAAALTVSDLADDSVYDAITGSADPVGEYDAFRLWANGIGVDKVVNDERSYISYEFGTTALLQNDPTIEITDIANADDGLSVGVVVKDGEDPVAVASAKVKGMFEATSDLSDWTKEVELTVTDLTELTADEVRFKVVPKDNPPATFIRLKY